MPAASIPAEIRNSSIQSVVNTTVTIIHPGLNAGAATLIAGIKLEGEFISTEQLVDNSKRVPMIDGSTVAMVNGVTAGIMTMNMNRISPNTSAAATDLIMAATQIQKSGMNTVGAQITVTYQISGSMTGSTPSKETWQFIGCVLQRVPPLKLSGNDVPTYTIIWSYDDYSMSVGS